MSQAQFAATVWGLTDKPYIGVRSVNHPGQRIFKSAWRWTNALDSWSWRGCDGNKALIEIYSDADSIELLINEKSLGTKKIKDFKVQFKTNYTPGSIRAVAYDVSGRVAGENSL